MDYKLKSEQQEVRIRILTKELGDYKMKELTPIYDDILTYKGEWVRFYNSLNMIDSYREDMIQCCDDIIKEVTLHPYGVEVLFNSGKTNTVQLNDKYTIIII